MANVANIMVMGREVRVGDFLTLTAAGRDHFGLPEGHPMQVERIRDQGDGETVNFYLGTDEFFEELGNPDDFFEEEGHGLKVSARRLFLYFKKEETKKECEVIEDHEFKGQNLKGLRGLLIAKRGSISFVELEKNVGGSSCDGKGKNGHCVIVPSNVVSVGAKPKTRSRKE